MSEESFTSTQCLQDGWFSEREVMWPGQRMSLKVKEVLYHQRTEFQDLMVFQSETYGRVLALDGVIQLTERDEFAYQEMIAHLPMFAHPDPKNVLIIGGGDGGVLREVARHPGVESITMCEIDPAVVEASKTYFPDSMATAFEDPRLTLLFQDGAKFLREHPSSFDVVIVDSSDPIGPAAVLFEEPFFNSVQKGLRPGGVACTQGECAWLHLPLVGEVLTMCRGLFTSARYAYTSVPTYPSGQIGFIIVRRGADGAEETSEGGVNEDLSTPSRAISDELQAQLRYYSPAVHSASFVLPRFAELALAKAAAAEAAEESTTGAAAAVEAKDGSPCN